MIKAADNIINTTLKRYGATVPLVAPDNIIHDISNYLAAGLFKQKDVPDEKVHSFFTVGSNLLKEYVASNYPADVAPGDMVPVTNQSLAYGVGLATKSLLNLFLGRFSIKHRLKKKMRSETSRFNNLWRQGESNCP